MKNNVSSLVIFLLVSTIVPSGIFADDPCEGSQAPGYCFSRINDISVGEARETTDRAMALPNRLAENDFNAINNPAHLMNHGTAYLEGWGGSQYVWGGATIPLPYDKLKLGIFLRRPITTNHPFYSMMTDPTLITTATFAYNEAAKIKYNTKVPAMKDLGAFDATGNQKRGFGNVDIFLGWAITSSVNIGLRLGYLSASLTEEDSATTTKSESKIAEPSIGLGVQIKNLGPGYLDVAASFSAPSASWDSTVAANTFTVKNKFAYTTNALVRYVMPVGQNKLIAAFSGDLYNMPVEMTDSQALGSQTRTSVTNYKGFGLDLAFYQGFFENKLKVIYSGGLGIISQNFEHKTDSVTGSGGPTTAATSVNSTNEQTQFFLPLGLAVEHQTLESMKTRIGIRKNVISVRNFETISSGIMLRKRSGHFSADDELSVAMGLGWTPAEKVNIDFSMNALAFKMDTFFSTVSIRYHY